MDINALDLRETDDQCAIRKSAREIVARHSPITELRRLRDSRDPRGFSTALWSALIEAGLAGAAIPERDGGGGLGLTELGIIMEECGRTLAATPLLSTAVLGATAIVHGESETLRSEVLPRVVAGKHLLALAHGEGAHPSRTAVTTHAEGLHLTGEKSFVLDGHIADGFVVSATTPTGLRLFYLPATAAGITITRLQTVDSRNAARVRLDRAPAQVDLGPQSLLDQVLTQGAAALAAEMLGCAQEAFDRTLDYLKTRRQFGVPIGSFQALKHRAAWMYVELELSRSLIAAALRDPILAPAAKTRMNQTARLITSESIQLHGGIGVTDEHDIGLFYKRIGVTLLGPT